MVTTFIALLGAVVGIALVLPKQYEAQMKILVRHERVDSVISAERETPRQTQTEVTEGELESEAELLKSKDLLAKVVIACNLDKEIDFSFWTSSRGKCARDRKSTRLNSSHVAISYAVFCLKKKKNKNKNKKCPRTKLSRTKKYCSLCQFRLPS